MTARDDPATAAPVAAEPWRAHYEPGVPSDLPDDDGASLDFVAGAAAVAPTFPAVTDGRRAQHFAALSAAADRVAAALARDGLGRGDVVVVALPPGPTAVAAILGGLRAGVVVAPADGAEASAAAELAVSRGARAAVVLERIADAFAAALERAGQPLPRVVRVDPLRELRWPLRVVAWLGGARTASSPRAGVPWHRWLGAEAASAGDHRQPTDGALLIDGVAFGRREIGAGARMWASWLTDASPGDDTWLILAPLSSSVGAVAALGAAPALRARTALVAGGATADVIDALRYVRPAWVVSDTATVARLAADPALAGVDLRGVRGWLVAGPVPPPLARAFAEASGVELCVGWAPAGAAGFVACNPINGRRVAGSVGLPLPGVRIVAGASGMTLRAPNGPPPPADGTLVAEARLDADGYLVVDPPPELPAAVVDVFRRGRVTAGRGRR